MLATLTTVLYILLPIALLTSNTMPSAVFYCLIAASLALLAQQRFAGAGRQTRKYKWLIASYGVLFLAVAASSIYYRDWAGANSEGALRFFLGLWILLLALPYLGKLRLQKISWGIYIAGAVSTAVVIWITLTTGFRPYAPTLLIVTYSSIMMLLCALIVYSLKFRFTESARVENIAKIALACLVFAGVLAAHTRTGLLGVPIFVVLGALLFAGSVKPLRAVAAAVAVIIVAGFATVNVGPLQTRIVEGIEEVQSCQGNSTELTSVCIRVQMWRAAIDGGTSHPWVGLGDGGKFHQYMQDVAVPKGMVAQAIVDGKYGEPHNDILLMFFGFGFPGALGMLLIYLAPCAYFLPRLFGKETSGPAKAAAAMGLAVCLGFLCFGITEAMFRRMNTMGFYTALVAWLIVLSDPQTHAGSSREAVS